MRIAVIGIGSNSVRMLVADVEGAHGRRIRRDRDGTRLFAGLGEGGRLDAAAMDKTVDSVAAMAASARAEGAQEVLLFATSATRDASNKEEFARRLREKAKVELMVCSGEEEAALSYIGASGGGRCGVIDIGGGSTEVAVGKDLDMEMVFSAQMGAVRLFRSLPLNGAEDIENVVRHAAAILEDKLAACGPIVLPQRWYGTGGTFTALAALVHNMPWSDRTRIHGTRLALDRITEIAVHLAGLSVEERRQLVSMQPNRADIIVHGICILIACMRRLAIPEIVVSEYTNIDGFVKRHYSLTEGLD